MYLYTVIELANRCKTTPHAVLYYTRIRLLHPKITLSYKCQILA